MTTNNEFMATVRENLFCLEKVKGNIYPKVINKASNEALLARVPHRVMADLAVIYIVSYKSGKEVATVTVSNQLVEKWGNITESSLYSLAVRNMEEKQKFDFTGLTEVLFGVNTGNEEFLYVLRVLDFVNGAAAVLSEAAMEYVIQYLQQDFFILPSSVHEVLVVPYEKGVSVSELKEIVRSVNADRNAIPPEDILSEQVYRYNRDTHELVIADENAC